MDAARWALIAAMHRELKGLYRVLEQRAPLPLPKGKAWTGLIGGVPLAIARTGVGGKRARDVCEHLLDHLSCKGIISIGYAGSLRGDMKVGDVLVSESVLKLGKSNTGEFSSDARLVSIAKKERDPSDGRVFFGRMVTTTRVIVCPGEKMKLGRRYDARAVEMESGFLAELAQDRGLPFVAIRSISDDVDAVLPDYNRLLEWKKKGQFVRIASYLSMHPRECLGMVRLGWHGVVARSTLTDYVQRYVRDLR